MQQRQELASGLDLLRGDVASFRRDLEELRAEQQQTVVTLGQLKQDVETSIKNSQIASSANAEIKTKVRCIHFYFFFPSPLLLPPIQKKFNFDRK